jgi:hypothetical protein
MQENRGSEKRPLTRAEAARLCGVCTKTLDNHRDKLKPFRFGKRVLYRPEDVEAFIAAGGAR